jgi:hypothetical protein
MRLTPAEYEATVEKIARVNARAAKRGWTGHVTVTGTPVTETITNAAGFQMTRSWVETEITGEPPRYGGWVFLAELDWESADELIVRAAPGAPPANRDGLRPGECDHCRTKRDRKSIYLVANAETGEQKQVGSSCIKDFLGHDIRPVFVSADEASFDEGFGCGGGGAGGVGDPDVSPLTVLAAAWGVIQVTGYHKADSDAPTKWAVQSVLFPYSAREREFAARVAPYFDRSYEQARIILDWVLSDAFAGESDYVVNLKAAARSETVGPRVFGLLVSAPVAWARGVERELRRQAEAAEIRNEWFGEEGQRLIVTARVRSIREISSNWGVTTLYVLVTSDGHLVKYFASRPVFGETADDTWYVLKGTVKGHGEYQGARETVLTRCVVLADSNTEHEPPPEPHVLVPFEQWLHSAYGWYYAQEDDPPEAQREGYEREVKRFAKRNKDEAKAWKARQAAYAQYIAPLDHQEAAA